MDDEIDEFISFIDEQELSLLYPYLYFLPPCMTGPIYLEVFYFMPAASEAFLDTVEVFVVLVALSAD